MKFHSKTGQSPFAVSRLPNVLIDFVYFSVFICSLTSLVYFLFLFLPIWIHVVTSPHGVIQICILQVRIVHKKNRQFVVCVFFLRNTKNQLCVSKPHFMGINKCMVQRKTHEEYLTRPQVPCQTQIGSNYVKKRKQLELGATPSFQH